MAFDTATLESLLGPRPLRYYEEVGSTNDLARAWLRDGAVLSSTVIANAQMQGRGRSGHAWLTPPGAALAVSVVLKPNAEHLIRLSMLGALAVIDLVRHVGVGDVGIKWPNDVLVQGRKIAGVLAEADWEGDRLLGAVLGIGVNVRVDFRGTDLESRATSLERVTGRPLDRADLLVVLLDRVDYWYERLDTETFFSAWRDALVTLGQRIRVGEVEGVAESVDADGALRLRAADGQIKTILAGDVEAGVR